MRNAIVPEELHWALVRCPGDEDVLAREPTHPGRAGSIQGTGLVRSAVVHVGLILATSLVAVPAAACWDGYSASHGNIHVMGSNTEWSPDLAQKLALWLPRLEVLLGEQEMAVYFNQADLEQGSVAFPPGRFDVLFARTARLLGTPRTERRAALRQGGSPLTIQIAATRDRDRADALVRRFETEWEDQMYELHGFYEAGGFPSNNPAVHLLTRQDDDGNDVYQVVVGAFINRNQATHAQSVLQNELAVESFIRPL
ncbi:MAG: SPOR domain-containing protein [Myxococcota bacterium]